MDILPSEKIEDGFLMRSQKILITQFELCLHGLDPNSFNSLSTIIIVCNKVFLPHTLSEKMEIKQKTSNTFLLLLI